ncbi:3-keto-disaccharide hydrolase [Rubritalea sp.]|uniref:3-keto-disaccharide hydrolase n=1 Tax=Rubritalea sp. TaxID=2109375 RepID=UPI003EF75F18
MKFITLLGASVVCSVTTLSAEEGFVPLFNGENLEGWSSARSTGEGDTGPFSVNKEEKVIHVYAGCEAGSKQKTDVLVTDKAYSHYILKLEYKWAGNRFAPRPDWDRDSGLLFHVHGDLTKVWPLSLEMQIGESPGDKPNGKKTAGRFHSGDLFVLGKNLNADTPVTDKYPDPRDKYYDPNSEPVTGRSVMARTGTEKPMGEWNKMEIQVHGNEKAVFILNGETVLKTYNFTQKNGQGEKEPLDKGHIGFQAEWAEILFRNIEIKELPVEAK